MPEIYSYGLLTISTVAFGFMFFFQDLFRANYGSSVRANFVLNIGTGAVGILVSLVTTHFRIELTWFTLIMALISTANSLLFSYCTLKAMNRINLSLYSVFSMLGGMTLPFISGILFHAEAFTLAKAICFLFITGALFLSANSGLKREDMGYYIGIFVFNGLNGVIAKFYQALPFPKVSSEMYSLWGSITMLLACVLILLFLKGQKSKLNGRCLFAMLGNGILSKAGSLLLLIALLSLPASAQYPFVTGGTMIVSAVISLFTDKKPTKRELLSISLSFVGILLLILLPEIALFTIHW